MSIENFERTRVLELVKIMGYVPIVNTSELYSRFEVFNEKIVIDRYTNTIVLNNRLYYTTENEIEIKVFEETLLSLGYTCMFFDSVMYEKGFPTLARVYLKNTVEVGVEKVSYRIISLTLDIEKNGTLGKKLMKHGSIFCFRTPGLIFKAITDHDELLERMKEEYKCLKALKENHSRKYICAEEDLDLLNPTDKLLLEISDE